MAAPGSRAAPSVLAAGDVLAARYRLVRPAGPAAGSQPRSAVLWLAADEVLARPVAAKVLPVTGPAAAAQTQPLLDAAVAAGSVASPVLVRVYDAAVQQRPVDDGSDGPAVDVAYVISEWVDSASLASVLAQDGPYEPADAVALTTTVAEGLSAAHASGVTHGRVHPGNVLVAANGEVRLTDLGVSTALPDGRVAADRSDDPAPVAADVRDLAAVLYALLTARWPDSATPQPSAGLPAAPAGRDGPGKRGRLVSPRQVRAGVPTALDALVVRALDPRAAREAPALDTAAGFSDALEAAVRADAPVRTTSRPRPRLPAGLRRWLPTAAVVAGLSVIGVTAFSAGREVGTVVTPPDQAGALASAAPSTGSATAPVDVAGVAVRDFDPDGDGRERPGQVANAHDGDLTTRWETERYDTQGFGGLKPGVGLLVDLGEPTPVRRVELVLARPGVTVELRAASAEGADAAAYRVLARGQADGERLALVPPDDTGERYYLLWITGLVEDEGRWTAGVAELQFTRAVP